MIPDMAGSTQGSVLEDLEELHRQGWAFRKQAKPSRESVWNWLGQSAHIIGLSRAEKEVHRKAQEMVNFDEKAEHWLLVKLGRPASHETIDRMLALLDEAKTAETEPSDDI